VITGVKLIGACVSDQQRALDSFTGRLEFEVTSDVPMGPGARWIEVAPPGYPTQLAPWPPPGLENRIGTLSQVVFRCDDVQKTFWELREAGVTFNQEPKDQPGGTTSQFVDPDGNTFVLRG